MKGCLTVHTILGNFTVVEENAAIIQILLPGGEPEEKLPECRTPLLNKAEKQLQAPPPADPAS